MLETVPHSSLYRRISHINIKRAPRKHARAVRVKGARYGNALPVTRLLLLPPPLIRCTRITGSRTAKSGWRYGVADSSAGLSAVERLENLHWIESRLRRAASEHPPRPPGAPPPADCEGESLARGTPRATPGERSFFPRKVHGKRFFAQLWVATAF
jgi:hypothetical protein